MEKYDLPVGWKVKRIEEICEKPQYGYTESASHQNIGPKFLRITDIQDGKVDWETVPYCKCSEVEKYVLKNGDIVFARTGATTGKSFLIKDPPLAIFASYLIRVRVKEEILSEYLYLYFQSSLYWSDVTGGIDDGNRPNFNGTKLSELEIPFPIDLNEQRRIIARTEEIASRVEKAKKIARETLTELESFIPALLAKAFKGEL